MKLDSILIVHPSRGRPELALKAAQALLSDMTSGIRVSYVFALDLDDPKLNEYLDLIDKTKFSCRVDVGDNDGYVKAVNAGAKLHAGEDLLFGMGDDLLSVNGWDSILKEAVARINDDVYLLHVSDIENGKDCAILQIMSSAMYRMLGWFNYPEYVCMYADNDLLGLARAMGCVHEVKVGFHHNHPTINPAVPWDETYVRENEPWKYEQGRKLFEARKAQNFGVGLV